MKNSHLLFGVAAVAAVALGATSCADGPQIVSLGVDDTYVIPRMQTLRLAPALEGAAYRWLLLTPDGEWTVIGQSRDLAFVEIEEGEYQLKFEIVDADNPMTFTTTVIVVSEDIEYDPYISRVYEYRPAPGQFVNMIPLYEEGDTEADMIRKAGESICGADGSIISLGGFGGYVTFGFDHTVVNVAGQADFRIWGNAFADAADAVASSGGSAEPGVVMVSADTNGNGLPDDEWYELRGSEDGKPGFLRGYSITYRRPAPDHIATPSGSSIIDSTYILWTDNTGQSGYMPQTTFHRQSYYPEWIDAEELTFTATRLPSNATDVNGDGTLWRLRPFEYGYVDNYPNDDAARNSFDISDAVDAEGVPVSLPGIDFVRVYTSVNQCCGWIGETSTEIARACDLHLLPTP
ncbi:MAG: cell surface protein [Muribaculaceae bacterium]|nr:cell surface protein [Muribaculaceae bacterium]